MGAHEAPHQVSSMLPKSKLKFIQTLVAGYGFLALAAYLFAPAICSQFIMFTEKVDSIPDIKQTDPRLALPDRGKDFCAPVAVLDSFVQLQKNGYDKIIDSPGADALPASSCQKIANLMETRSGSGTTTENFLKGLSDYIRQFTPYKIRALKYQGWNRHQKEFDSKQAVPQLSWLKNGIQGNRCEWINIGWYSKDPQSGELRRNAGHWVSLIGYGMGISGESDPNVLIVRDPDPVLSNEPRKIFVKVEKMQEDLQLTGPHYGLPRSSLGYLRIVSMGNGVSKAYNRTGIIDGAIVLDLQPSWWTFGN
jgi:hypothetical protein